MIKNKIIAHRGAFDNKTIVENTIDAFKKAIELKIPFELDIQLTKDNKIVVFHDFDLKRLSKKNIKVQETTYEELKKIDLLNTNSKIPLLKDVLALNHDQVYIDIEIKKTKRWKELVDLLMKELKPYLHYIVKSFDPRIVKYIKKNYSWVYTGLLIEYKYQNVLFEKLVKSKSILGYCHPDFLAISKYLLKNKKYMKKVQNIPLYIWTIKKEEEMIPDSSYIYICNNLLKENEIK